MKLKDLIDDLTELYKKEPRARILIESPFEDKIVHVLIEPKLFGRISHGNPDIHSDVFLIIKEDET